MSCFSTENASGKERGLAMFLHKFQDIHCPHCNTHASHFVLHAAAESVKRSKARRWKDGEYIHAFVSCEHCSHPSVFVLRPKKLPPSSYLSRFGVSVSIKTSPHTAFLNRLFPLSDIYENIDRSIPNLNAWVSQADKYQGETLDEIYEIVYRVPESDIPKPCEEDIPADLSAEFSDLIGVINTPRHAIIGCRRVIERACRKRLGENASNKNIHALIDAVLADMDASKQISEWARALRHLGNETVHTDDSAPTPEEARQAYDLTRLLLDLIFVYPKKIERMRKNASEK
jgi:hypothetical protein